jgi:hypothetical protein
VGALPAPLGIALGTGLTADAGAAGEVGPAEGGPSLIIEESASFLPQPARSASDRATDAAIGRVRFMSVSFMKGMVHPRGRWCSRSGGFDDVPDRVKYGETGS